MYLPRLLSGTLTKALGLFPAVMVTGPRQSGKTTFLLHEFGKECDYVTFDDPLERNFALADPHGFLNRFPKRPVILDEIQYVPEILPYLKMRIDKRREENGKWLLTGSQQFQLMKNISESLAGRIALLELPPFSLLEMKQGASISLESILWVGGYPEPAIHPAKRELWLRSYIQTYLERDVRQLLNVKDLRSFETFLGLCAAMHGQTFNAATLARKCGVSLPTIKAWAGVLEASFLCRFLAPYFNNYGKRLVKTPKFYFIDPAIVCALTRQPSGEAAIAGPMGGALFEGLVTSEAYKVFSAYGRSADIFFWRSNDGLEVDLIIQIGHRLCPVEIKLTATPTLKHLEPLSRFASLAGKEAVGTRLLVCRVEAKKVLPGGVLALPWQEFPAWLEDQVKVLDV